MFRFRAALVSFGVLTGLALFPPTHRWDKAITAFLQRTIPSDFPASALIWLGYVDVTIPAAALAVMLLLWINGRTLRSAVWLVLGLVAGTAIEIALKAVVPHPAPGGLSGGLDLPLGLTVVAPYGFPSGHTLRITMIACTVLQRIPWLAGALVLSVMVALVRVGYHWPSEVLGGLCLGWALLEARALIGRA
jgi:membrane-associated phospholipid phosphatase